MARWLAAVLAGGWIVAAGAASAQAADRGVRIGVLTDLSGAYSETNGQGDVIAAQMAIDDFGGKVLGKPIELISGDHLNKADVGAGIARKWFDVDGVDAIVDVPNSAVALAVNQVAREKKKVFLATGAATPDLTGKACSPTTVHWTYDTWMLAHGTGGAIVRNGGDTWFFLTADYAFGHALEHDTGEVVEASGGKVLGAVRAPLNTSDFSSFLLQAQASKAKVVGLANAGTDTINSIKQAQEFGIVAHGQKLAGLLVTITDVKALGLNAAQGLTFTTPFYWDVNDATRAWSRRFAERANGKLPNMMDAGAYSAVLHYLKAIAASGTDDGPTVVARMKAMPTDDPVFGKGEVRPDGREIHPVYLVEVKKPAESTGPWDLAWIRRTIPAQQAFRPLSESACPLLQRN